MKKLPFSRNRRRAFSLIELLIFTAIFSLITVAFIAILVAILNVQSRQSAAAEVNQQSQFLLQEIQYYTERSSLIDIAQDSATSTLKLRLGINSQDPTYIYASGTTVYLKQTDGGTPQALTTSKVNVNNLTFTKHSNAPSHDSVSVSFTVAYNTGTVKQVFSQALQTAVARVSAATFDSSISPSSTDSYTIGTGPLRWSSINGAIYFNTNNPPNVGIGTASIGSGVELQVSGGNVYIVGSGNGLIIHDPTAGYCWTYKPTTATGAWNISSSTCP